MSAFYFAEQNITMLQNQKAFSLIELILVVLILGVISAIAVPRINFSAIDKQRASVETKKLSALIRKTRSLAILNAAVNNIGYRLKMTGTHYTGYEIINLKSNKTIETGTISSQCSGASTFNFGPLGNRLTPNNEGLTVTDGQDTYSITVVNSTGMVKWAKN